MEDLPPSKVFAVVHISQLFAGPIVKYTETMKMCMAAGGRQFKITSNDLIVVNRLLSTDIGDKICLEKVLWCFCFQLTENVICDLSTQVLLVGSEDFTLIGNPVLRFHSIFPSPPPPSLSSSLPVSFLCSLSLYNSEPFLILQQRDS